MSTPLLTQVRPPYFSADCGMAYIMRLSDGRFVIIDGNVGEYDEPEHLYTLLSEQNENGGEPTVAAWFITHPHGDHFGGFSEFCKRYSEKVKIEKVLYHFPKPGVFDSEGSDTSEFFEVLSKLDTETVTPRTGDIFNFADARFEVLFSCEDLYPGPVKNINNSSFVMTMELGKYKILWLGDLQREGAEYICKNTDKAKLKCDILVCTVERGEEAFIANGSFVFEGGDIISIIASPKKAADFFNKIGYKGYSVNVGSFDTIEKDNNGKSVRKTNEVDFYAVKGLKRYYIQVCTDISNAETRAREERPCYHYRRNPKTKN